MKYYFKNTTHVIFFKIILICMVLILPSCGYKNWVQIKDRQCKIFDPHPMKGQSFEWNGKCESGRAHGYGVLSVFENGKLSMTCEGNAASGYLHGFIIFSLYKNETLWCQYEERWYKGKPYNRIRNVTLEKYLSKASSAREYLFFLKKYQKEIENTDIWIDDYHQILLQKTVFACKDMEVHASKIQSPSKSNQHPSNESNLDKNLIPVNTGKAFKNELLFKIYDYNTNHYVYYTVYNHRVASLKELTGDKYIPGGKQFYINDTSFVCENDNVPEELPSKFAPIHLSKNGRPVYLEKESIKEGYWYPVKNL